MNNLPSNNLSEPFEQDEAWQYSPFEDDWPSELYKVQDPPQWEKSLKAALEYQGMGYHVIPMPKQSKQPFEGMTGWTARTYSCEELRSLFEEKAAENLAVVLGRLSGDLVDVDLDCPEALAAADFFLPKTGMISGHRSNPR